MTTVKNIHDPVNTSGVNVQIPRMFSEFGILTAPNGVQSLVNSFNYRAMVAKLNEAVVGTEYLYLTKNHNNLYIDQTYIKLPSGIWQEI